jgi:hypothetical protein
MNCEDELAPDIAWQRFFVHSTRSVEIKRCTRSNDGDVNSLKTKDREMASISNAYSAARTKIVPRITMEYSDHS